MKVSAIVLGAFAPSVLALTACMATNAAEGPMETMPPGQCNAAPAQPFVGQKATLDMGKELQDVTGAARLRWVPPRTAVTMDYRPDRLTVSYDDDYVIDSIKCG